jgi:hypothetical protein
MSTTHRNSGVRIRVIAAATRTSGVPTVESGFHGIPQTDVAANNLYSLHIGQTVEQIPTVSGATIGKIVYITETTGALGNAAGAGIRAFGKVVAVGGTNPGPSSGNSWVLLLPQPSA